MPRQTADTNFLIQLPYDVNQTSNQTSSPSSLQGNAACEQLRIPHFGRLHCPPDSAGCDRSGSREVGNAARPTFPSVPDSIWQRAIDHPPHPPVGCQVDEANAHPCMVLGHDIGGLLYDLGVMGWLMLVTIPTGAFALLIFTLVLVANKLRQYV